MRRRLLFEADGDEGKDFTPSSQPEDDTGDTGDTANEDENNGEAGGDEADTNDDSGEEGEESTDGDNEGEANEDNEDFKIDAEDDTGEEGDGDASDDGGDDNGSSDSDSGESPTVDNEDTRRDKEIFDSLSPQEQKLKTMQMKKLYMELYANCNYVVEKINSIGTSYDELNIQIKKSLSILFNLKTMINDYLLYLFDSKSYFDNDAMFNIYLSILNSVKHVIKDIC